MSVEETTPADPPEGRFGRRRELLVFAILAVLIWPVLAVGFVGAYGFLVWMWQIIFGPPGPPG
jgi:periplasmic nitrate reductase NapE